jgi:hypothetical protein
MRSGMNKRAGRAGLVGAAIFAAAACGSRMPEPAAAAQPAGAEPQKAPAAIAHGDHNPHHGGIVLMKGNDLHYEVVAGKDGHVQLFFSDALREDLPASVASRVSFVIKRPGEADEAIDLKIDETGESWIGSARPVTNPAKTTVRVAFTVEGDAYWIDVPLQ